MEDQAQCAVFEPDATEVGNDAIYQNSLRIFKEKSEKIKRKAAAAAEAAAKASTEKSSSLKKSFVADNGVRYMWDEEEDDWVEADNDGEIDDDDEIYSDENDSDDDGNKEAGKQPKNALSSSSGDKGGAAATAGEKRKRKRKNKSKNKAAVNNWVYITGLPADIDEDELKDHFGKVGLIAINPYDQAKKIKIYRDTAAGGSGCKGDASLCYASQESVKMAIEILHEGYIRPNYKITVSRAEFSVPSNAAGGGGGGGAGGSGYAASSSSSKGNGSATAPLAPKRQALTKAQIDVANSATKQALSWNDEGDSGVNKAKALKIVVLQGMFHPSDIYGGGDSCSSSSSNRRAAAALNDALEDDDEPAKPPARTTSAGSDDPTPEGEIFLRDLEADIADECTAKCGLIDKITVFSHHPKGIVVVKFATAYAAEQCISLMDGRWYSKAKLRCFYWDGVTNYSLTVGDVGATAATAPAGASSESVSGATLGAIGGSTAGTSVGGGAEEQEEKRLDEFGSWLEEEQEGELPAEFQLRVAE